MSAPAQSFIKRKIHSARGAAKRSAASVVRDETALLNEVQFTRLISLERKRSERSGRSFLLMLLDGCGLFGTDGTGSVRERLGKVLLSSTRETDLVGWYKKDRAYGVLFPEISEPASEASEIISAKIKKAMREELAPADAAQIQVSMHLFPQPADPDDEPMDLTLYPDIQRRAESKKAAKAVKRTVDVLGSLLGLVLLSPVLILLAFGVKLTSKGPVLFRQKRVGQYGRQFTFLKFRSMYVNNDDRIHQEYVAKLINGGHEAGRSDSKAGSNGCTYKITNDPRITRFGYFLRRSSLDELPQLINVLMGEMSLVGPRPSLPYEVKRYSPWHRARVLEVKPGITGLWQVTGRSRTTFDEMVRLDLQYIQQSSVLLDLEILFRTPRAVFSGDGAY